MKKLRRNWLMRWMPIMAAIIAAAVPTSILGKRCTLAAFTSSPPALLSTRRPQPLPWGVASGNRVRGIRALPPAQGASMRCAREAGMGAVDFAGFVEELARVAGEAIR